MCIEYFNFIMFMLSRCQRYISDITFFISFNIYEFLYVYLYIHKRRIMLVNFINRKMKKKKRI